MTQCVFCKIVKGELPSLILEETADFLCLLPIDMECFGHTLIVPKQHYADVASAPAVIGQGIFQCAQTLSQQFGEKFGAMGFNLLNANGIVAEQSIPHLHFHFLPRREGDGITAWPPLPGASEDRQVFWQRYRGAI